MYHSPQIRGFPGGALVKNLPANARDTRDMGLIPGLERAPGGGMATHASTFAWEINGQRNLVGYSPWGHRVGHD